jgi:hypothetical protein
VSISARMTIGFLPNSATQYGLMIGSSSSEVDDAFSRCNWEEPA